MRFRASITAAMLAGALAFASGAALAQTDPTGVKKAGGSGMHGVGAGADPVTPGAAPMAAPMDSGDAMMKKPMMHKKKKMMHKKKMMKKM